MSTVTDDAGRSFAIGTPPRKIVSLVPSITELICQLGAASRLVGVTTYCTHPADALVEVERVGGTKNPTCDRIAALEPDLVFVDRDENRREDFDELEGRGLTLFVAQPRTAAAAARTVERIGAALAAAGAATEIARAIDYSLTECQRGSATVRVFCPIWRNPWMSFNGDTYAADLLRVCGGANVCEDADSTYPKVSLEAVARAQPQVVLLPDEPYIFQQKHLAAMPELQQTPAWRDQRIHLIDGKAMFWYGARTAPAIRLLRSLLHPALGRADREQSDHSGDEEQG